MEFHVAQILIVLPLLGICYGVWILSMRLADHFTNHNQERNKSDD